MGAGQGNTNAGSKVYICATAQTADLDQAAFTALTWVVVGGIGNVEEIGRNQPLNAYTTWDRASAMKAKGTPDYGTPELEVARDTADAGQDLLRTASGVNLPYAIKIERNDKLTVGGTNSLFYNRALVTGPRRPLGRSEDFDIELFNLGFIQAEVDVDPT